MRRKHTGIRLENDRDVHLIVFLWKWKAATSALLMQKFFPEIAPATAYRRLWTLAKGGFIEARCDRSGAKFVWTLAERGWAVAKQQLPHELEEDGFKAEHLGHDLLASAFHLGDWALGSPPGVKLFSEQQLRRYHKEDYPSPIPSSQFHRADGYTLIPNANDQKSYLAAFEVEINIKKKCLYDCVGDFYRRSMVDDVFWLVPTVGNAKTISKELEDRWEQDRINLHSFVLFDHFKTKGWHAPIILGGKKDKTIAEIFGKLPINIPTTTSKLVSHTLSLNVAKAPHKSKSYKTYELGNFTN